MTQRKQNKLIPLIAVLVGGFIMTALCYLTYLGIVVLLESTIYASNISLLPMDTVRNGSTLVLVILYLLLYRSKVSDLVKATVLVAPITLVSVAMILHFYQNPVIGVILCLSLTILAVSYFRYTNQSWLYYIGPFFALILATLYAWPRP